MAGKIWGAVAIFLGLAVLLVGCAGAPSPQAATVPQAPLPQVRRSPQEVALERALGEFYGAPYHAGGTTPAGVDCSGLVQALLQSAGVKVPRTVAEQYNYGRPVGPGELRFGDVVLLRPLLSGEPGFLPGQHPAVLHRPASLPRRPLPG